MNHISQESIDKAIGVIDELNDEALEKVFENFANEQSILLEYAMTAPTEYQNEQLEGLLVYYFCLICECFKQEGFNPKSITEEQIEAHQNPYFEMLDAYFENNDEEVIDSYVDQPQLSKFMAIEVSTEDDDGTTLSDETASQLFIVCLSMVALLNQAISEG
ncbi:MAG: hypothetical protein P8P80_09105 [Crocinitomicaceae bacterium]|mgnify:CR=1 FL=1|jgi:hypothetical protein|nr:hypothetical protein [Crocinitomicaceae bacterium]MDG1734379.1 hypothetical protein [Crocinitomicaceae bacterium]MDG2505888.1 hypothetical protein [Crocinitomicaceae bacterium]